jgi:REP element-mobilizing transposase RayT
MARPLRYEAAGAVYHVMARGDGGREVFETDLDRHAWLDVLERCCERHGWRVHAWVMMGNHFHLLLETPEPNLGTGMRWFMGVVSQGWNRRRKRRGHVFQGRYKAVIVNGEGSGHYFRIVADYIHLNPVRSGWVGGTTGRRLKDWRWSSFPQYAGRKAPEWLEVKRVLKAFELADGRRGQRAYARYLEARAMDRGGVLTDASLKALRRGWYLGEPDFGEKLRALLKGAVGSVVRRENLGGGLARAHDEAEAERLAVGALKELGLPVEASGLAGRGRFLEEKALVASLIRKRTGVRLAWVAERLGMGVPASVSRAVRRTREEARMARRLRELERRLQPRLG